MFYVLYELIIIQVPPSSAISVIQMRMPPALPPSSLIGTSMPWWTATALRPKFQASSV